MKSNFLKFTIAVFAISTFFVGCTLYDDVTYKVEPSPLEVHGDKVTLNVTGSIAEKSINKNAVAELTPVLRYNGQETTFKSMLVQGENAAGNGTVISSKTGGTFSYSDEIDYHPDMMKAEVFVKVKAGKGTPDKELEEAKIADGVVSTPYLVVSDDKAIIAKDNFQRVTQHSENAQINFVVNQSFVRSSELRQDDIKDLQSFLGELVENPRWSITSIGNEAYASPEGEISKNENLANERAESGAKSMKNMIRRAKIELDDGAYSNVGKGEDWEGFRAAMSSSEIEDKQMILRILETYTDKNKREEEIRNLAATYLEIKKEILPDLRRTQISVNYEKQGYSDEELRSLVKSNPDTLNVEEMLFAATLFDDMGEKQSIYSKAKDMFAQDYRAWNNLGYTYMMQNNVNEAENMFKKANELQPNPVTTNNMAICTRLKGDREQAYKMLKDAVAAGDEVKHNMAIIDIQNGNYADAVRNLQGVNSVNAALARILNGDATGASGILNDASDGDTATAHYLRAVIAARSGDGASIAGHLAKAVEKDASLKDRAMKDVEFLNFMDVLGL